MAVPTVHAASSPLDSATSSVSGTTSTVTATVSNLVNGTVRRVLSSPSHRAATTSSSSGVSGNASATGLQIVPIVDTCVSCTSASAGSSGASSTGTALRLLGQNLVGGSSNSSGALLALPANPLVDLKLLDWVAQASSNAASARTALADLSLGDGKIATVAVLESISSAQFSGNSASGHAVANGVDANIGDGALVIVLLHSESSSSGGGSLYLVSINGTEIGRMSGSGIPITIPGVATITLLSTSASGGLATASLGSVTDTLLGQGNNVLALGTGGSGGTAPSLPSTGSQGTAVTGEGPSVPVTGAAIALGGLGLLGAGTVLLGASARRRKAS